MAFWNNPTEIVPKKQSSWVVLFGLNNLESNAGDNLTNNRVAIAVAKSVSKPSYQLKTTQHKYLGRHEFHYPNHVIWQPIKLVFTDAFIYETGISSGARYLRPSEYQWDTNNKKVIPIDDRHQLVRRSTQMFFHQALKQSGYYIPTPDIATATNLDFKTATFKEDLIKNLVGRDKFLTICEFTPAYAKGDINNLKDLNVPSGLEFSEIETIYKSFLNFNQNNLQQQTQIKNKIQEQLNIKGRQISTSRGNQYKIVSDAVKGEEWKIYNPIVTDVNFGELNYDQEGLVNISVTIAYDYADLSVPEATAEKVTDDNISKNYTREVDLGSGIKARVRVDSLDESTSKELIAGLKNIGIKPKQTFDKDVKQQASTLAGFEQTLNLSSASKIDIDQNKSDLNNSLLTTEAQAREELGDIQTAQKNLDEIAKEFAVIDLSKRILSEDGNLSPEDRGRLDLLIRAKDVTPTGDEEGKISTAEYNAILGLLKNNNGSQKIIAPLQEKIDKFKKQLEAESKPSSTDVSKAIELIKKSSDFTRNFASDRIKETDLVGTALIRNSNLSTVEAVRTLTTLSDERKQNAREALAQTIQGTQLQPNETITQLKTKVENDFKDELNVNEYSLISLESFDLRRTAAFEKTREIITRPPVSADPSLESQANLIIKQELLGEAVSLTVKPEEIDFEKYRQLVSKEISGRKRQEETEKYFKYKKEELKQRGVEISISRDNALQELERKKQELRQRYDRQREESVSLIAGQIASISEQYASATSDEERSRISDLYSRVEAPLRRLEEKYQKDLQTLEVESDRVLISFQQDASEQLERSKKLESDMREQLSRVNIPLYSEVIDPRKNIEDKTLRYLETLSKQIKELKDSTSLTGIAKKRALQQEYDRVIDGFRPKGTGRKGK